MKRKIAIIGAGEIGRAIEFVLKDTKQTTIVLWDIDPLKVPRQAPLPDIVSATDMIFLCVPSWATRKAIHAISPHLEERTFVLSLAKGIEQETGKTTAEILAELLPHHHTAVLHGPMLAEELTAGLPGAGVIASTGTRLFQATQDLFADTKLTLEFSQDMRGVALAGVLKNVYALGMGMISALELGSNFTGWYIEKATDEMGRVLQTMGGSRETAYGAAGLGDLVATGLSPHSRNRQLGQELARTGTSSLKSEGLASLPPLLSRVDGMLKELPLIWAVHEVMIKACPAREAFELLPKTIRAQIIGSGPSSS